LNPTSAKTHHLLIIDDNEAIHADIHKILRSSTELEHGLAAEEAILFGLAPSDAPRFELDSAYQGQEGLEMLEAALARQKQYSCAFVDVRMPPGWDGIETITHLWKVDPGLPVVICTAYTDYSWNDIVKRLGRSDNYVILKKPFDNIEVLQLAHALSAKREATQAAATRLRAIELEVQQRTLAERELVAALAAAEESNRCKREFLSTMGHELRTPLNAIIGYSEMLEQDAREYQLPPMVASLQKVQKATRHLLGLINDILDMSKIESGKMDIHIEPVAIGEMARDVVGLVSPLSQQNRNKVELKVESEDLRMAADAIKFQQCLLNLVGNACKFTADGTISVAVNREVAGDDEWIHWSVRDTGIGIDPAHFDQLFQPFTQLDSKLTRKYGGTGLGLAISHRLCEMMGAKLDVQSELGKGSEFTIRIPAWDPKREGSPASGAPPSSRPPLAVQTLLPIGNGHETSK
jgi:two-component system sensor histidine kinase/response regulator